MSKQKKPTKEELFEYLDGYSFVNRSEITMAVLEFFEEEMDIRSPSYGHCMLAGELADEYIQKKGIKFDEEENII